MEATDLFIVEAKGYRIAKARVRAFNYWRAKGVANTIIAGGCYGEVTVIGPKDGTVYAAWYADDSDGAVVHGCGYFD